MDFKYYDLTPVEVHNGMLLKRDDLYDPFGDFGITGGKVRQCLFLVESNLDSIMADHGATIATAASVHSPQACIVARVAKEFGLKCIIGHGAKDPLKHPAMRMCADLGAELVCLTEHNAYNNVLYARLADLNKNRRFFTINFGYQAATNPDAILEMNANQVRNIPPILDALVINVGSGVSAAGILAGVARYNPYLLITGRVHLIQPFGYDRRDVASQALDFGKANFIYHKGNYPYHKPLQIAVDGVRLDDIYEAKAFDFMMKVIKPVELGKVCYWIIGNSNVLRS